MPTTNVASSNVTSTTYVYHSDPKRASWRTCWELYRLKNEALQEEGKRPLSRVRHLWWWRRARRKGPHLLAQQVTWRWKHGEAEPILIDQKAVGYLRVEDRMVSIFVTPAARRRGLALRLLRRAQRVHAHLMAFVDEGNDASLCLFLAADFRLLGKQSGQFALFWDGDQLPLRKDN